MIEENYRYLLRVGKSEIDEEMTIAIFCEKMGWTYEQFLNQPQWLLDTLWIKWRCDGETEEELLKKTKIN